MLSGVDPHDDVPQLARSRFLRGMWAIVDQHGPPNGQTHQAGEAAEQRLLELGAAPDDLRAFARLVAFESLFAALSFLDDPGDGEAPDWALVETSGGELTGRRVQALYEDLGPDR
ncbi:hypothetical protein DFR72_112301 [Lentzea flaviverrucosa]|uniref:Uncharacterized protein n=1 Tax=Lentzea flaviverrucosa TaxID=200379 RepID=A0A1H9W3C4_9PSEU|nr:hypothetical protein DFR72_112301 [Lentzea flaviverrucosa]SES28003.1 hypothetical protein SAMN05216195_1115 [Lentzea flaviverrucosa]